MGAGSEIRDHWSRDEQLESEDWREYRRQNQEQREQRRIRWSTDLQKLADADLVTLRWFSVHHVRVTSSSPEVAGSIDVHPSTARWYRCVPRASERRKKWGWSGLMSALGISEEQWRAAVR